jgi:hypothetical protein
MEDHTELRSSSPPSSDLVLTPWGQWLLTQPKGTMMSACRATRLSWATVTSARTRLVLPQTAHALSRFARGAFTTASMSRAAKKKKKPARAKRADHGDRSDAPEDAA